MVNWHVVVAENSVQLKQQCQRHQTAQVVAVGQLLPGRDQSVFVFVLVAKQQVEMSQEGFKSRRPVQTTESVQRQGRSASCKQPYALQPVWGSMQNLDVLCKEQSLETCTKILSQIKLLWIS